MTIRPEFKQHILAHRPLRREEIEAGMCSDVFPVHRNGASASEVFDYCEKTSQNDEVRWGALRKAAETQSPALVVNAFLAQKDQQDLDAQQKKQATWLKQALACVPMPVGAALALRPAGEHAQSDVFALDLFDPTSPVGLGHGLGKHLGTLFVDAAAEQEASQVFFLAGGNFNPKKPPAFPGLPGRQC